ncbi:hypothetical protein MMC07_000392 [Pseudocyphellaria aurata]|nr:hypothetical protein [Pseudocyphellaria aurata]
MAGIVTGGLRADWLQYVLLAAGLIELNDGKIEIPVDGGVCTGSFHADGTISLRGVSDAGYVMQYEGVHGIQTASGIAGIASAVKQVAAWVGVSETTVRHGRPAYSYVTYKGVPMETWRTRAMEIVSKSGNHRLPICKSLMQCKIEAADLASIAAA